MQTMESKDWGSVNWKFLDWHGDKLSWAAVVKAASKAGYNRIAKKLPTNILLFHKLAALYQCVSTLSNLSVPSVILCELEENVQI